MRKFRHGGRGDKKDGTRRRSPHDLLFLLKGRAGLIQTCMELYDRLLHCGFSTSAAAEIINDLHTEKQVKTLESFLRMQELMDNDESEYV
mgnify:CR=1 FL=1